MLLAPKRRLRNRRLTLPERVMAASHSLVKAEDFQQSAQIVKTNGSISGSAEKSAPAFSQLHIIVLHLGSEVTCLRRITSGLHLKEPFGRQMSYEALISELSRYIFTNTS